MLGWHCLNKWDFVRKFKIDVDVLKGWLELVEESYEDTAYHNCEHLVVSLSCHNLLKHLNIFFGSVVLIYFNKSHLWGPVSGTGCLCACLCDV